MPARGGVDRLVHPDVGELRLAYETLDSAKEQALSYLPADDATSAALDRPQRPTTRLLAVRN